MTAAKRVENDPKLVLPPAVRRAAEQADKLYKQSYSKPDATPPADPALVTPEVTPPAPEAPPAPELVVVAPVATPEPPPAPAPVPEINWEHRYKSMEGRYKRAEGDIRLLSDQVASMQTLMANMQEAPKAPTPQELKGASLLTPEEVNEYGAEFLGVVAKKAKEELSPEVQQLKAEIDRLNKKFEGNQKVNAARARTDLEAALAQAIPNWREVNVNPDFHAWLALPDMFSGGIRHQLLTTAYEQNNAPRVLAFFKGFLSEEAAPVPTQVEEPVSLETLAAPGRAKTAAPSANVPVEKPIFTHAHIARFYADAAAGRFRGKEAEKDRIEKQIFDAQREGRIR